MNKKLLKLGTVGAAVTLLLALLIVTQGCTAGPQADDTTTQTTGNAGSGTSGTEVLLPDDEYDTVDTSDTETDGLDNSKPAVENADIDVPVKDTPSQNETGSQSAPTNEQETQSGNDTQAGNNIEPDTTVESTEPKYTLTLKEYESMSPDQQLAYMNSFPKIEDYIDWLRWARAEDSEDGERVEIGEDGSVDIGDYNP